jgi:hypothetical protein
MNQAQRSRGLWASVLDQAIQDASEIYGPDQKNIQYETEQAISWVERESEELQSFCWVCDILDLNKDRVKTEIYKKVLQKRLGILNAGYMKNKKAFKIAVAWLCAYEPKRPGSFAWICKKLNIDRKKTISWHVHVASRLGRHDSFLKEKDWVDINIKNVQLKTTRVNMALKK